MPKIVYTLGVIGLASSTQAAKADTILFINDAQGNIGQVDLTTKMVVAGSVHNTGQNLTDIAFNSTGTLYGTTFTNLFSINQNTGVSVNLGSYSSVAGINALVGSGTGLIGASNSTTGIYQINPDSPQNLATINNSPATSAGDLAFVGSTLYQSAINAATGNDELVNVTAGAVVGQFGLSGVFGLADDGTALYAVNGTEVYSVNAANAALTPLLDYSLQENGQNLGQTFGSAFFSEAVAVPEPTSAALLGVGLLTIGFIGRRHGTRASPQL